MYLYAGIIKYSNLKSRLADNCILGCLLVSTFLSYIQLPPNYYHCVCNKIFFLKCGHLVMVNQGLKYFPEDSCNLQTTITVM